MTRLASITNIDVCVFTAAHSYLSRIVARRRRRKGRNIKIEWIERQPKTGATRAHQVSSRSKSKDAIDATIVSLLFLRRARWILRRQSTGIANQHDADTHRDHGFAGRVGYRSSDRSPANQF